ncbi:hypothetical protein RO3G_10507 [Rhizopus delemar RA 99-880]|uniref:Uncharacterized protein n=1 Tax=Rhizopus delemar (strain RA 99-880 / ATCC MYA-4621 / FGSC 9543 / NRRL 43880) TaxID=246409 RepID=I1CBG7_RHIO9|nr:hypothetical protein RO3G_10507 [Rhizopus delemar RA 99-880]|eukprot:EIE85797.1 hypothetical protein RO3G_10507 [Rhizopus delemar RA 99-880]
MTHVTQNVKNGIALAELLLFDQRIVANLVRFMKIVIDAAIQDRFKNGGIEQTYDLLAILLGGLHSDEHNSRLDLNNESTIGLYHSFNSTILAKLSALECGESTVKIASFLNYYIHQKTILSNNDIDIELFKCFCYHLCNYLQSYDDQILEMDTKSFYRWLDSRKAELSILFNKYAQYSEDLTRERAIWGPEKDANLNWRLYSTEVQIE